MSQKRFLTLKVEIRSYYIYELENLLKEARAAACRIDGVLGTALRHATEEAAPE